MQNPRRWDGAAQGWRQLAVLFLCCFIGTGLAYNGLTIGLSTNLPPRGAFTVTARAVYPMLELQHQQEKLQFSARSDLSYGFGIGSPALAVSGILSSHGHTHSPIERYVGAGAGISFTGDGPLVAALFFTGARIPVTAGLHGVIEVQVASTGRMTVPSVSLGLDYSFGGFR